MKYNEDIIEELIQQAENIRTDIFKNNWKLGNEELLYIADLIDKIKK